MLGTRNTLHMFWQVKQQQEQYAALHQAAAQRLQHWKQLLQSADGASCRNMT